MERIIRTQELPDGIILITLTGAVMGTAIDDLELTLKIFFDRSIYKFIIDISKVDYLTSKVASIFINTATKIQENKGKIVFVQSKPVEETVFGMLGLSTLYLVTKDVPTALAAFK